MSRIVRKQSILSRIKSYPLDLLLELNERRELIDWDLYAKSIALPLGSAITILQFFIDLWQAHGSASHKQKYFQYDYSSLKKVQLQPRDTTGGRTLAFLQMLILLINIINTLHFLLKTKKYTIFNKKNLNIKGTSAVKSASLDFESMPWYRKLCSSNNIDPSIDQYTITVWNPTKFSTYFFISFSPLNLIVLYLTQPTFKLLLILVANSALLSILIGRYTIYSNDKQLIFAQTFQEYQDKFVNPKLAVPKREVSVDATKGAYYNDSIHYYSPGRKEALFKSHDHDGVETIEKFQSGEFTPIKKSFPLRKSVRLVNTPLKRSSTNNYMPSPLSRKPF